MSKQVYISADYDYWDGDQNVVDELKKWGKDSLHKVDYIDLAQVESGSVAKSKDCRICELKNEFNQQINASSAVIFVVGEMTAKRSAGSNCERNSKDFQHCYCTPYKQNTNGTKLCKCLNIVTPGPNDDYGYINKHSYLQHEFEQAKKRNKSIIIVYNSIVRKPYWLPSYMKDYENIAKPFWKHDNYGRLIGDYAYIKEALGF